MAVNYCSIRGGRWGRVLCALPLLLLLGGCGHPSAPQSSSRMIAPPQAFVPAPETQGLPLRPDPALTPGATLPVTAEDICVSGYSEKVRNVPLDVKRQAYAEYGITQHAAGEFEVDHLISLELGGSNSLKNLWPQSYHTQPWNAHVKDALENALHEQVCTNQISLPDAQRAIATDWIGAYQREFHTSVPLASTGGRRRTERTASYDASPPSALPVPDAGTGLGSADGANNGQVWVNTHSGKYFLPGSRYYGNTKQGAYMPEAQAQQQGYVLAGGHSSHDQ